MLDLYITVTVSHPTVTKYLIMENLYLNFNLLLFYLFILYLSKFNT